MSTTMLDITENVTDTPDDTIRSTQAEALFTAWNIPFRLVQLPVNEIRPSRESQVRSVGNVAPTESVEQYLIQLKAGAKFPPITVQTGGYLVDGYTRWTAHRKAGRRTLWAYEITPATNDMVKAVAAALNQMGGVRLTAAEAQDAALVMLEQLGFNDEQVAMHLGRTGNQVRKWRRQAETAERAAQLGMTEQLGRVSPNVREQIATVSHAGPFAAVLQLVADVKPTGGEVSELLKKVRDAASDEQAVTVVTTTRDEWMPQGPEPRKTQANRRAGQARRIIPQILHITPVDAFDPLKADADLALWTALGEHVQEVVNVLRERCGTHDSSELAADQGAL